MSSPTSNQLEDLQLSLIQNCRCLLVYSLRPKYENRFIGRLHYNCCESKTKTKHIWGCRNGWAILDDFWFNPILLPLIAPIWSKMHLDAVSMVWLVIPLLLLPPWCRVLSSSSAPTQSLAFQSFSSLQLYNHTHVLLSLSAVFLKCVLNITTYSLHYSSHSLHSN